MRILFFVVSCLLLSSSYANGRELARDGNKVRLDAPTRCNPASSITVTASSADYFDQDALTLQRLANTARAILLFECPQISTISFTGLTDKVVVFKATASKSSNWALETDPAPLEGLALLFGLQQPDFFYLGTLHGQLKHYRDITGIENTFQFKAYQQQMKRFVGIIDGDTSAFQAYIKNPGRKFENFDSALAHYGDIVSAIKAYAADQYPAYNQVYTDISATLKHDYWSSQIDGLLENDEKSVKEIIAGAETLLKTSPSTEFHDFVDTQVASWLSEEGAFIKSGMANAPLHEVAWASEYLAGFPEPAHTSTLTKSQFLIQQLSGELLALVTKRKEELQSLAVKTIQETGGSHEDVDTVLDTGFALADSFEAAGYVEEGQSLIVATLDHIDGVLKSGLQAYREELKTIVLTGETVAALQEQALAFEELSTDIEGLTAYKKAIDDTLKANRGAICENILKEAQIDKKEHNKLIDVGNKQLTLSTLACDLFENQHIVTEFRQTEKPDSYILGIEDAGGTLSRFHLKSEHTKQGQKLHVDNLSRSKDDTSGSKAEGQDYIAHLLLPPPNGKPDAKGVRDCDWFAADPSDSNKLAPGVNFEKDANAMADIERAIDACIAAVEDDPQDTRQQFQLGRVLWYAGDQETANQYVNLAASANYAPAFYYQGEMLLSTSTDKDAFIDALDLFKASGKGGYAPGNAMVKELNPDGLDFYKEIPPPTPANIVSGLKKKGGSQSFFGITASIVVIDVKIKECFQTSATDFSCEFKAVAKCEMSGPNDPAVNLLFAGLQEDCKNTRYVFGSFRKLENGKWEELPSEF